MKPASDDRQDVTYFDNAATSWPKPPCVHEAMVHYLDQVGANPGRAGHFRAAEAGRLVLAARRGVARLCGLENPMRVLLGPSATWGLNQAIQGLLQPGDHVVTTSMEHNSVLRPLHAMTQDETITLTVVNASPQGVIDPDDMLRAVRPETALLVVTHASNVCGALQPVGEIGQGCRRRGIPLLVDAAQTAGVVDLDMVRDGIDLLAFAGHKGLLGPTGTGGLVLADTFDEARLRPLMRGGTGSRSDSIEQPDVLPDRFESGTLNVVGLAGLAAGIEWLHGAGGGVDHLGQHERQLRRRFLDLAYDRVPGFIAYGPLGDQAVGVASFQVVGFSASELSQILADRFGVLGRQGMHCAPLAHRALGTFPEGTLRFGFGPFNNEDQIIKAVDALATITTEVRP